MGKLKTLNIYFILWVLTRESRGHIALLSTKIKRLVNITDPGISAELIRGEGELCRRQHYNNSSVQHVHTTDFTKIPVWASRKIWRKMLKFSQGHEYSKYPARCWGTVFIPENTIYFFPAFKIHFHAPLQKVNESLSSGHVNAVVSCCLPAPFF